MKKMLFLATLVAVIIFSFSSCVRDRKYAVKFFNPEDSTVFVGQTNQELAEDAYTWVFLQFSEGGYKTIDSSKLKFSLNYTSDKYVIEKKKMYVSQLTENEGRGEILVKDSEGVVHRLEVNSPSLYFEGDQVFLHKKHKYNNRRGFVCEVVPFPYPEKNRTTATISFEKAVVVL